MAEKITFNTGAKSYEIVDQDGNELGVFRFIPTDVGILLDIIISEAEMRRRRNGKNPFELA